MKPPAANSWNLRWGKQQRTDRSKVWICPKPLTLPKHLKERGSGANNACRGAVGGGLGKISRQSSTPSSENLGNLSAKQHANAGNSNAQWRLKSSKL